MDMNRIRLLELDKKNSPGAGGDGAGQRAGAKKNLNWRYFPCFDGLCKERVRNRGHL